MTKRLFVAIKYKPNTEILNLIKEFKIDSENDKIKWVDTGNMHLTLNFSGDTDAAKITDLIHGLQKTAENNSPLALSVKELGAFYRGKFPSILFLNLNKNDQLFKLANSISKASKFIGFSEEKRKFKAHITLARIKFINDLQLFNDLMKTHVNQTFNADSFLLFESKLTPKGPEYSVVEEFML